MAEIQPVTTPDLGQTVPQTDVELASSVARSQEEALRGQAQAISLLARANVAATAQRGRSLQALQQTFANLDFRANNVRKRSEAQSAVVEATLRIDERIQELSNTPGVRPLDLASGAEAIIREESNNAVGAARGAGRDVQNFVQTKLNNLRLNRIPAIRREGYKREGEEQVAATNQRNFRRKAELYAPGTTEDRKMELMGDIVSDIEALSGLHLSADRAEALVQSEIVEFKKNNLLSLAIDDPVAALAVLPELGFTDAEQLQFRNQISNILAVENNKIKQEEAREAREQKARAEETMKSTIEKMIFQEADPRRLLADPARRADLNSSQISTVIRFHDTLVNHAKKRDEEDPSDLLRLKAEYASGRLTPQQVVRDLTEELRNGSKISANDAKSLMNEAMSAFQRERTIAKTDFQRRWQDGEENIKRLLTFEAGFITLFEKDRQTQLNLSLNTALDLYRTRLNEAMSQSQIQQVPPLSLVRPASVANEVILDQIGTILEALPQQKINSLAFQQMVTRDSLERTPRELNKEIAQQVQSGLLTSEEGVAIRQANMLAIEFNRVQQELAATRARQQQQQQGRQ